jgi:hypothetical protein
VLVPVGKLDGHLHLGIDGAGRADDQVARDIVHGLQAGIGPGLIGFGSDVGCGLGVGEKEVVEDDFVEVLRRELGDVLYVVAVGRLRINI